MSFKIVVDSCCELPEELYTDGHFIRVPLELQVGDYRIKDDDAFDQADFLKRVAESSECARSACPPPESYMDAYASDAEDIYVVTIGSKLSGSYNSAVLASELYEEEYEEEHGHRNIHVVDSASASSGETQLALKLYEYASSGMAFADVVSEIEAFRDTVKTYFVIDNLDTFIKNGRLSGLKAAVATTLSIKPILTGVDGQIEQIGQAMGIKKATTQMCSLITARHSDAKGRRVIITHCNCGDRAAKIADALSVLTDYPVMILPTRGVSTMYANDGGVIVTL